MQAIVENRRILEDMRAMGRTRNTLTPMIGLSLAALVAGSLVTLAVLAQRVSLDIPLATPVLPRPPQSAASPPPLVVENPPPALAEDLPRQDADVPVDRVLPLRIARPATPAKPDPKPNRDKGKKGPDKPDERRVAVGLPPGIVKKMNRGRELPPGHSTRAAATAKRFPQVESNGQGRGACGPPPCGVAAGNSGGSSSSASKGKKKH